jgi:diguanylate cyclase (GGDEF)-like protein
MSFMPRRRAGVSRKAMAQSAAAMWAAAAFVVLVESAMPGGGRVTPEPGAISAVVAVILLTWGRHVPVSALVLMPPLGVALISASLAETEIPGDGAALYVWPVLWMAYFYRRAGAILIVAWVGICHAATLFSLDPTFGAAFDRWVDVMVSMGLAAVVVEILGARNERLVERLAGEARVDTLTGLLNRRGFHERAEIELARAKRAGTSIAVVSLDIDHFKLINDEWGHDAGDRVLARLGDIFRAETREGDVVARMGGEEFVALLSGSDLEAATDYAERVRLSFAAEPSDGAPRATISAGAAAALAPEAIEPLIHGADSALYAAKGAGRDRLVIADGEPAPVA